MNTYLKFMALSAIIGAAFVGQTFGLPKTCTYRYWDANDKTYKTGSYGAITCAECSSFAADFHKPQTGILTKDKITCS